MPGDRKPVTQVIAQQIRQYIVRSGLEAGQRMPSQRRLAQELGVSRNSLREALVTLNYMGVVTVLAGRGVYVGDATLRSGVTGTAIIDPGEQFTYADVYELRFSLEAQTARLAARRASDRDIRNMRSLNRRLSDSLTAKRLDEAMELDYELHMMIADVAGNAIIRDVLARYRNVVLESQRLPLYAVDRLPEAVHEHELVLDAIAASDPALAEHSIRYHLLRAAQRTGTRFSAS